jgi:precorrin-3B C17-methyltransferase
MTGGLSIVGIGPGGRHLLTPWAAATLRRADRIIGYEGYVDLVRAWLPEGRFESSPIGSEAERAAAAVAAALAGEKVALIGSGDAGVYGLAGLALETMARRGAEDLQVAVVPGVTAATAAAALLGAPLGHDFAVISLSDLLTPWEKIRRRLEAAAAADFVTVLYNPASSRRRRQLEEAKAIFLEYRSPATPVGHVISAYRAGQSISIGPLSGFNPNSAGMMSTLIIGNSSTWRWREFMITPRGYHTEHSSA